MHGDTPCSEQSVSGQQWLCDRGVLCCDIEEFGCPKGALDDRVQRKVWTTAGRWLLVSVPSGLRSACFRLSLPEQRALAVVVLREMEDLAERIGTGNRAEGMGIAANQSAAVVAMISQIARQPADGQLLLTQEQRKASAEGGGVPAFFRYQDPDGNVIRMFNPVDASPREPDGSYTGQTNIRPERCLSSIEFRGQVSRPLTMVVEGTDLDGNVFTVTARGPAGRLMGHELSHVNGGIGGLCVVEDGLPVLTLEAYSKLRPDVVAWRYPSGYQTQPYLTLSDGARQLDPLQVRERLADQGMFTAAPGA